MRKTKIVTIASGSADALAPDHNRDFGKTFKLTEMSAREAETFADKASMVLTKASDNADAIAGLDPNIAPVVAIFRLLQYVRWPDLQPLKDELFRCVEIIEEQDKPPRVFRPDEDVEEVSTLQFLRSEVCDLHTNFTAAAVIFNSLTAAMMSVSALAKQSTFPR